MHREEIVSFLKNLRHLIIEAFEAFEPKARFEKKEWKHAEGGGGEMAILRGEIFEKAAVNWSGVQGAYYPLDPSLGAFFATGVSLITHMSNPHAPTVHFNIRYMEAGGQRWIGGGYDLTPMGEAYQEDTDHFHAIAKQALGPFGEHLYEEFSQAARRYFYIPHWKKERGVGGIFFDHYHTQHFSKDLAMWKQVGQTFLQAILPIYQRRVHQPYTEQQKQTQLVLRGHYAEFNLVYDRGTKFGFQSGGNPEAILCSLPPLVKW